MSKLAGTVHGDELWLRCPSCGDSQRRLNIGHFSVNLTTGAFCCVRCQYGGHLTPGQFLDLAFSHNLSPNLKPGGITIDDDRLTSHTWGRRSLIERQCYTDDNGQPWEAFPSRDPQTGENIGWYLRNNTNGRKTSLFSGERGLGWVYDGPVISTPDQPIRLVEGPYDIVEPNDVCCYGLISDRSLKLIGPGHYVIACPDGDVWWNMALRDKFMGLLKRNRSTHGRACIVKVEILADGQDPDDVPVSLRKYVYTEQIVRNVRQGAFNA